MWNIVVDYKVLIKRAGLLNKCISFGYLGGLGFWLELKALGGGG